MYKTNLSFLTASNGEVVDLVTEQALESLAKELKSEWKKLATELNFGEDEIVHFEGEDSEASGQALRMLTIWKVKG